MLVGEHGFEPWNGGFKGPCLTTWRLPKASAIIPEMRLILYPFHFCQSLFRHTGRGLICFLHRKFQCRHQVKNKFSIA